MPIKYTYIRYLILNIFILHPDRTRKKKHQ